MNEKKVQETDVAVLILGYNRPNDMRKLIEALRLIKPARMYFSVDGPSIFREGDNEKVLETQRLLGEINWNCNIKTRFLATNMGCKVAISSAIDWFFENEDYGIILEDDCIPTPAFFNFAAKRLIEYKDNPRVMHVSGSSYFMKETNNKSSYYYSRIPNVWGWATWKRAWNYMQLIDSNLDTKLTSVKVHNYFHNRKVSKWFLRYIEEAKSPNSSVWSTSWTLSIINNQGVCISPMGNLVKNIGFRDSATHSTSISFRKYQEFKFGEVSNLPGPKTLEVNEELDRLRFKTIKKTDPNEFFSRKIKLLFLRCIYKTLPKSVRQKVKPMLRQNSKLTDFFMK
jgi:hypothetical protein